MRFEPELPPDLILPPSYQVVLRRRLAEVATATSAANCLIGQAHAEGMVEALELLKALEQQQVERLYLLIEQATTARLLELEQGAGE